jgi:hypothetical protein
MSYGVYGLQDAEGRIRYIGKGKVQSDGGCARWAEHQSRARSSSVKRKYKLHNWLAKNKGWRFCWLVQGLTEAEAYAQERQLVERQRKLLGRALLNASQGGRGMTSAEAKLLANLPTTKSKKSEGMRRAWSDQSRKAKWKAALKEANGKRHRREQSRAKALEEWKAEDRRAAARQRAKDLWADPAWAAARRAELRARNTKQK